MTGIITNIQPYSTHDGPGIRTTVFFKGCQLACKWCCNPETQGDPKVIQGKPVKKQPYFWGHEIELEELVRILLKDRQFYDTSGGGVTLSGGDPLYQPDFTYDVIERLRAEGVHVAVDTYGHCSWDLLSQFTEVVDLWLYDIKSLNETKHKQFTGQSYHPSLNNLIRLHSHGATVNLRLAIIPGFNDTEKDITDIATMIKALFPRFTTISLFPYHVYGADKYKRMGRTYGMPKKNLSDSDTLWAKEILENHGLTVNLGF